MNLFAGIVMLIPAADMLRTKPEKKNKMVLKIICGIFCLNIFVLKIQAQDNIPVGTWRLHLAYNRATGIANSGNRVFCTAENGLFVYDAETGETKILSKSDGISDITVTAIASDPDEGSVILGYDNGNIDLIRGYNITNIPGILKAQFSSDKSILDIEFRDNTVYFITGFGVIIYDRQQGTLRENWINLGTAGENLKIYHASLLNDTLFLGTEEGVLAGSLDPEINLQDYHNWRRFGPGDNIPDVKTTFIEMADNRIFAVQEPHEVYVYGEGTWTQVDGIVDQPVVSLNHSGSNLIFTLKGEIVILDKAGNTSRYSSDKLLDPQSGILRNGELWVADRLNGLVHLTASEETSIYPGSPFTNNYTRLFYAGNKIVAIPGLKDPGLEPPGNVLGFSVYQDGQWINFNNSGYSGSRPIPDINDLADITYNDYRKEYFFASFGNGVLVWDPGGGFKVLNDSTPGSTLASYGSGNHTLITSVNMDNKGNVWMINYAASTPLHRYDRESNWSAYSLADSRSKYVLKLVNTLNEDLWMVINPAYGGGILVYNEADKTERVLTNDGGAGGLPSEDILDLVMDQEGQIWVATGRGIAYYPFPFQVLNSQEINAIRPVYNQGYLFRNEKINCIEIDPGNRKWIGTDKGAWLFNEDGTALVKNFNADNSPLISDVILDITVHEKTGEVFFATDKGIVSYRGDAIEPPSEISGIKIFPNPVTPGYNGIVGIQGLAGSSIVKITDISGKLIFQTKAEGGMATWNVLDYKGRRASTGIYLIFSSGTDGADKLVGKLAVVN